MAWAEFATSVYYLFIHSKINVCTCISVLPSLNLFSLNLFWVGLVSTSKLLSLPQSHFKDKSAPKGWGGGGALSLKYAGENTDVFTKL